MNEEIKDENVGGVVDAPEAPKEEVKEEAEAPKEEAKEEAKEEVPA